ncbi:MAG: hypothetical protein HUU01_20745 [Saprospiraceae bacterium]|nr:hypothetical protein [Saprospiraceae bacterium]
MKHQIIFFLPLFLLPLSGFGQHAFATQAYFSNQLGDSLQLANALGEKLSPYVISWTKREPFKGDTLLVRSENTGEARLEEYLPGKGLAVFKISTREGQEILLERPVILIPDSVRQWQTYKDAVPYTLIEKGVKKGTGTQTFEVKVEGANSAITPLFNFSECLVIHTISERKDAATGSIRGYKLKEWYAKGIGLVKVVGEYYWLNPQGKPVKPPGKIAAMLERALVNGEELGK